MDQFGEEFIYPRLGIRDMIKAGESRTEATTWPNLSNQEHIRKFALIDNYEAVSNPTTIFLLMVPNSSCHAKMRKQNEKQRWMQCVRLSRLSCSPKKTSQGGLLGCVDTISGMC